MNIVSVFSRKPFLLGLPIVILILLAALPLYGSVYSLILLAAIFMYIVLAVSWAMFSAPTGYMSLAPSAFFGAGVYTSAILGGTLPMLAVIGAGGIISFCLALLVGALTLRLRGIYFTIFTLGLIELIQQLMLWYEINMTGTRGRMVFAVDNESIYYVMLGILVITLLTAYFIRRSKFGLALQSIGENEDAAAHRGVNVTMVKIITFAITAFFMGATGAITATRWTYIDPYIAFNLFISLMPILMTMVGGIGQLFGPILGAVIFSYLEEFLLTKFPQHYMFLFGIILLAAILYLPKGLVGLMPKREKEGKEGQHADT